eukprot:5158667-Lingulodinium_polyedra.AAC.1
MVRSVSGKSSEGSTANHKRWQSIFHLASANTSNNACRNASRSASGVVAKKTEPVVKTARTASPDT